MKKQQSNQQRLIIPTKGEMYAAISKRDQSHDGVFFYGVVTTGVYCRPSCAARLANPENVRYFSDTDSAAQAGFRPCKRCKPDNHVRDVERLIEIARYIDAHSGEKLTLASLSKLVGLSAARFQKTFKTAFGVSPKEYQDAARLDLLKTALKDGDGITSAIYSAGFGSTSRVYGETARNMGMTPAAYRAGGAGEKISYASRSTSLGPLLMAATERGVCFAQFGDSVDELLQQLEREFPNATLEQSPLTARSDLDSWIDALNEHLSHNAPRPDLPLDLRGTAFQLNVWKFLLSVSEGDVLSYGELASGIDKPRAFRAAATACGTNKIGVLIPCHRVLRGNGDLGGYRWGVDRKRAILDIERRNSASAQ